VLLTLPRPIDEERINLDGGPEQEDAEFDYDAVPSRFFFDVETVGGLDPDQIVTQGIKTLQVKLATIIKELRGGGDDLNGQDYGGAQSPQMHGEYGGPDQGFITPYAGGGGGGGNSVWGAGNVAQGSTTPYGATPYGGPSW
jgi:DNA-directed RNA polymerase II subunit RPB3